MTAAEVSHSIIRYDEETCRYIQNWLIVRRDQPIIVWGSQELKKIARKPVEISRGLQCCYDTWHELVVSIIKPRVRLGKSGT